jgi:hypothetical protein
MKSHNILKIKTIRNLKERIKDFDIRIKSQKNYIDWLKSQIEDNNSSEVR